MKPSGFAHVRGGIMTVGRNSEIDIATREAVAGDELATLDAEVLARFQLGRRRGT
jgi:F-type H+-transporting ATPase subunit epsilon